MRRGVNGGLIIEIMGSENVAKADALAKKLREALKEEARVSRPTAMGELQCWNMDDTVDSNEVKSVISIIGDCDLSEIRTGVIRRMHSGLNSVWIKCPLAAAIKVAATGRVRIGWTSARVRLLEPRPVQCFKCWRFGHVRNTCRFPEDRTGNCFRCGSGDHVIRDCRASPRCAICSQSGRGANHRLGSLYVMSRARLALLAWWNIRLNTWRCSTSRWDNALGADPGSFVIAGPGPFRVLWLALEGLKIGGLFHD